MTSNQIKKALTGINIQTEGTELAMLSVRVLELQRENDRLKKILAQYEEEDDIRRRIKTVEEIVCIKAIEDFRDKQQSEPLNDKDAKAFATFVEKLYQIRGKELDHGNKKQIIAMDVEDLIKVVEQDVK